MTVAAPQAPTLDLPSDLNLPLHEICHLVGYRKAGASIVHIRPWQDGYICTGFPASCETGTQLPLIAGLVGTLLFDTRLSKVREKAAALVLQTPALLPHLIAPLGAYDDDLAALDVHHQRFAVEVREAIDMLSAADVSELVDLAHTLKAKGSLTLVTEGAPPVDVKLALHEMGLLPTLGAA